jgi:pimeloyl-ACP methyl ester carboxylesterase
MPDWKSDFVDGGGVRIHYTRTGSGSGKPPLVLAHGFSDNGLCWTPVAAALEADYDVVMPDARGHGLTDAPEGVGYGACEQAADLAGLIRALGLERPVVLGHSMGAVTALAFAGLYPDLPRAVLLEDPPAVWSPPTAAPAAAPEAPRPAVPAWLAALEGKTREEMMAVQRASTPHWSDDELGPWADAKAQLLPKIAARQPGAPVDWPALLAAVRCPVLLITGDPEKGAIVTPDQAEALKTVLPHSQVAHVPGTGHSVRRDDRDNYLTAVRNFLAAL